MNWGKMASMLHSQRLKLYLADGMGQREASKRAYKDVGEELKLFIDGFEPKPDDIDRMRKEFQGRKKTIEDLSDGGRLSRKRGAAEKKQVWEDVHRKFGTQKKKSVNFEKIIYSF